MNKVTNFQIKWFGKSVPFVFVYFRVDCLTVRLALVNLTTSKKNSSVAEDRSKVQEAKFVLRKVNPWVFCLSLSGCADIYNVCGIFSNICQEVNFFSHEWVDQVQDVIEILLKMVKALDHFDYREKCLWPRYHGNTKNIHRFWSLVHKYWYAKANEILSRWFLTFSSRRN